MKNKPEVRKLNFLSLTFLLFFALTLLAYYLVPKRWQNILLLIANYVFYMWQNPVFGALLLSGTAVGYGCARAVGKGRRKKLWLAVCTVYSFGLLFVFKYLNFSCALVMRVLGRATDSVLLDLVLPIGISFFSFSIVGYVIDVYRGKMEPERNFIDFAAFASLFPSIMSGPINRAREILPQLKAGRRFSEENFKRGLWRFVCGGAKKLVVAGGLSQIVDAVYASPYDFGSAAWLLAALCYSFQIYVDFAAYSDMALGVGGMLGLRLDENFDAPYLSLSVKDFWKRWHISLTSWFREYLYFPLGGSRRGVWRTRLNILIVFAVSGLWHGAATTFIVWGLLNGAYQVAGQITQNVREKLFGRVPKKLRAVWQTVFTFALITAAWVFFRASNVGEAVFILKRILLILRDGAEKIPAILTPRESHILGFALFGCVIEDILTRAGKRFAIEKTTFRFWLFTAIVAAGMFILGHYGPGFHAQDFVYFKF